MPYATRRSKKAHRMVPAALAAVTACLVLAQSAAAVAPTVTSLTVSPNPPTLNQTATFTAAPAWGTDTPQSLTWNFGDGTVVTVPGATTTQGHAYSTTGSRTVTVVATNTLNESSPPAALGVAVPNVPPVAAFSFGPASPVPGQEVQFASASSDPGGSIAGYNWNFGDGASSPLPNPSHPYATAGAKTVTLTVTDSNGATNTQTHGLFVQGAPVASNAPPLASFAFSPRKPTVGQQVEFVSSAIDPEGHLTDQRWDLDGDGQFDDARGDVVLETYTTPGPHVVRLRVVDAAGASAVHQRVVPVQPQVVRAGFLNPFPVVRITGEVGRGGTRIRLLGVRAPRGTLVRVTCRGRRCPARLRRLKVGKSHAVRFKTYERLLRPGLTLEVFVRKSGTIGKFTRFTIRSGSSPRRTDSCLLPGKAKPVRCPS